jgi:hypothetical protein
MSCLKYKGFIPSFSPVIHNLSTYASISTKYALVYINGSNFLPQQTFVNFGSFVNLPITFYSSFNISFIVPMNALPGKYTVVVNNIYNDNFSPAINVSYPGNNNFSNVETFTIF